MRLCRSRSNRMPAKKATTTSMATSNVRKLNWNRRGIGKSEQFGGRIPAAALGAVDSLHGREPFRRRLQRLAAAGVKIPAAAANDEQASDQQAGNSSRENSYSHGTLASALASFQIAGIISTAQEPLPGRLPCELVTKAYEFPRFGLRFRASDRGSRWDRDSFIRPIRVWFRA
jgi:hypothetical protein